MWRWIFFLVGLCVAVLCVVWFVQNPGDVSLQWQGWRIDTSVGVLMIAVLLFAALTAVIYRFWRFLVRVPGEIGSAMRERRQRKGYTALSSGMVAVAAGDAQEARRQARRAESLLSGQAPLSRLLSAQSAQLEGDEKAAERFFTEMLDDPETRFLGLRGLLTQAVKAGQRDRALELAGQAYRLQPKSEWVASTLFDLQSANGLWISAAGTNDDMARKRLIEKHDAERRRAVISFERAKENDAAGDAGQALKDLRTACDLAPDLIPAVVALTNRCLLASGDQRRWATALVEKVWAKNTASGSGRAVCGWPDRHRTVLPGSRPVKNWCRAIRMIRKATLPWPAPHWVPSFGVRLASICRRPVPAKGLNRRRGYVG